VAVAIAVEAMGHAAVACSCMVPQKPQSSFFVARVCVALVMSFFRLVCCDASSNALFDGEAKSIPIIFESI
jgi:hypothetical protein